MKWFLECCYQRDVPPETIQNLQIFKAWKSVVFAQSLNCATTTRKIFVFFRVGPPGLLIMGGPVRTPHEVAASCQEIYFYWCAWRLGTCRIYMLEKGIIMTKQWTYTKNEDDFMGSENRIEDRSVNPLIRIADALEEILRLVKEDQEKFQKINEKN